MSRSDVSEGEPPDKVRDRTSQLGGSLLIISKTPNRIFLNLGIIFVMNSGIEGRNNKEDSAFAKEH